MIFFSVKRKITIQFQSKQMTFQPPPSSGNALSDHPGRIYCCTTSDLIGLGRIFESMLCKDDLQVISETTIKSRSDFPVQLGVKNDGEWERNLYYSGLIKTINKKFINIEAVDIEEQISHLKNIKNPRIAVLNGFGSGFGDTLIGVTAFLSAFEKIIKIIKPKIEVIYSPRQHKVIAPILKYMIYIDEFHIAPMTLKKLLEFDAVFDTGGMAQRVGFSDKPIVDFFLASFGLNPDNIHENKKRNTLKYFQPSDNLKACIQNIRDNNPGKKIILLHPKTSSKFKNIPDSYIRNIIHKVGLTYKYIIITDEYISLPVSSSVIDLSKYATSFYGLCDVISQVDGILTADTCVYHIADCFDIPTIAWFTMYDPDVWAQYYPCVTGVLLGKKSGFLNQKPENTEANLIKLNKLWEEVDFDKALLLLENSMKKKFTCNISERENQRLPGASS